MLFGVVYGRDDAKEKKNPSRFPGHVPTRNTRCTRSSPFTGGGLSGIQHARAFKKRRRQILPKKVFCPRSIPVTHSIYFVIGIAWCRSMDFFRGAAIQNNERTHTRCKTTATKQADTNTTCQTTRRPPIKTKKKMSAGSDNANHLHHQHHHHQPPPITARRPIKSTAAEHAGGERWSVSPH